MKSYLTRFIPQQTLQIDCHSISCQERVGRATIFIRRKDLLNILTIFITARLNTEIILFSFLALHVIVNNVVYYTA